MLGQGGGCSCVGKDGVDGDVVVVAAAAAAAAGVIVVDSTAGRLEVLL